MKPNHFSIAIIILFLALSSCKKQFGFSVNNQQKENISTAEVFDWFRDYKIKFSDGPAPDFANATKTFIDGQYVIRVPLKNGGGEIFLSKNKSISGTFFRRVQIMDGPILNGPFTGYYEWIDLQTLTYKSVYYEQGVKRSTKRIEMAKVNDLGRSQIRSNSEPAEYNGSRFGAVLYCIGKYLFAIPKKNKDDSGNWTGGWDCYGPGASSGGNGDLTDTIEPDPEPTPGGGTVYIDLGTMFPTVYPVNSYINVSTLEWVTLFGVGAYNEVPGNVLTQPDGSGFIYDEDLGYVPLMKNLDYNDPNNLYIGDGVPLQAPQDDPFIDLGYETTDLGGLPRPGNIPKRTIASTVKRSLTRSEDTTFGTNGNSSFIKKIDSWVNPFSGALYERNNEDLSDQELLGYLKDNIVFFSRLGCRNVAKDILIKYKTKTGGIYSHPDLTNAVKESSEFKNFKQNFASLFSQNLTQNNGDISNVSDIRIDQNKRPSYDHVFRFNVFGETISIIPKLNLFNGLSTFLHDTDQTNVEITNLIIENRKWTGTFIITIQDWFGIDKDDYNKFKNFPIIGKATGAWWILQHVRGYPPLHTTVSIPVTLSGNF